MNSIFSTIFGLTALLVSTVATSNAEAATTRLVTCEMQGVPEVLASVFIEDDNGRDVLKSIEIVDTQNPAEKFDHTIDGTLTEKNVTGTALYKNSEFLQQTFAALGKYDSVDLLLAKDGVKTAEEILESIADDASGLYYAEAKVGGKMTTGILLAGWGGFYINCKPN